MSIVLLVVTLVIVAWFFGFVKSVRKAANIANSEVDFQADRHALSIIDRRAAMKIDADKVAKAQETKSLLDSIKLD